MLYEWKQKIRHSKWGDCFTKWLATTSLFPFCYEMLVWAKLAEPLGPPVVVAGQNLREASHYFRENKDKVEKVAAALADKKSKQIFLRTVDYRSKGRFLLRGTPQDQYFPKNIIRLSSQEVFIDCGAFTGDTISKFLKVTHNKYKKIVAFEPDPANFVTLKKRVLPNCFYFNEGVWDKPSTLSFWASGTEGSSLVYDNDGAHHVSVLVRPLDEITSCRDMTFLKMDIEGAELNALKGAEKTIRKQRPKMAICIYHSDRDMLEIPLWIMSLNMGYKLYVRHHHGFILADTVLYAV